jgi:bla regulator protein blaR1
MMGYALFVTSTIAVLVMAPATQSQVATVGAQFDVVSIKPHKNDPSAGGGIQTLPDGTFVMTNHPIRSIILGASPVPVREVSGLPNWANADGYDIVAKPPAGSTREQRAEMMRNMFIERMKLVGHVEEQERTTFALVIARSDGRLGPQLKPSTLDCERLPSAGPQAGPPDPGDAQNRCGLSMGQGAIVSGGITIDRLVHSLGGLAGGLVNDRTGLKGWYAVTLRYAPPGLRADTVPPDDAPQFVTALQEQLGLKLQPEKTRVPIFVIDHIERPTPNDR